MARTKNPIASVQITISTTPLMKAYLEKLVRHGTYGKTVAEAAERLVAIKVTELMGNGQVATSLEEAFREHGEEPR